MNQMCQINQVAESQPDADDSIVPISTLRNTPRLPCAPQTASWKLGMTTVDKQGDQSRLYTNLCRETLWRASQAVLSRQGIAKTTKTLSDGVWEIASDTPSAVAIMLANVAFAHPSKCRQSHQT